VIFHELLPCIDQNGAKLTRCDLSDGQEVEPTQRLQKQKAEAIFLGHQETKGKQFTYG